MVLLVRYGELALKSTYVRRALEDRLAENVRDQFAANGVECVVKVTRGRLFVHADDEVAALRLLRRVFGIVSASAAKEVPSDLDVLTKEVAAYARGVLASGQSFAIRPRRSGQHTYTSQELARVLGTAVQDAIPGLAVNLDAPNREIHVEVRGPRAYVFHEVVAGPGGLPLGSQGTVLAVAEDDAGMVATWLVMRRGCRPRVAGREPFLAALQAWDPRLAAMEPMSVPSLLRLAEEKGEPLVLACAEGLTAGDAAPFVLRPLVGLWDADVADLARRIRAA